MSPRPGVLPIFLSLVLALAACGGPPDQFLLDVPTSTLRLQPLVQSVEVRGVSLPRYVTESGLVLQQADGSLVTDTGRVWADDIDRAMTLGLVRNLAAITGARVARDPWPYATLPAASVLVTVEQFLADAAGTLRLDGNYSIAPVDSGLSDRTGRFAIRVPIADPTNPAAVAQAHATAVRQLAETVARSLAR